MRCWPFGKKAEAPAPVTDQRYRPYIEVYEGQNGNWYYRFRAHTHTKIGGPDPYDSRSNAIRGAESLAKQLDISVRVEERGK